jgi:hypothetical protein
VEGTGIWKVFAASPDAHSSQVGYSIAEREVKWHVLHDKKGRMPTFIVLSAILATL